MKNVSKTILYVLSILFILWIMVSWFEITTNNLNPNPEYSTLNFFELLLSVREAK